MIFWQDSKHTCYEARFRIDQVEHTDSRFYDLMVQNGKGTDKHSIHLTVRGSYTGKFTRPSIFNIRIVSRVDRYTYYVPTFINEQIMHKLYVGTYSTYVL